MSLYTADTVGVVISAVEKLNQTIDGQTTLRVETGLYYSIVPSAGHNKA